MLSVSRSAQIPNGLGNVDMLATIHCDEWLKERLLSCMFADLTLFFSSSVGIRKRDVSLLDFEQVKLSSGCL